jgi:hypothetical protein
MERLAARATASEDDIAILGVQRVRDAAS